MSTFVRLKNARGAFTDVSCHLLRKECGSLFTACSSPNPASCLIHPFNKKALLFREDTKLFLMKLEMNDACVRGDKQTSNMVLIICPNYTNARGSWLVGFFFLLWMKLQVTLKVLIDGGVFNYRRAAPDISEVIKITHNSSSWTWESKFDGSN